MAIPTGATEGMTPDRHGRYAPPGADLSDGPRSDRSRCNSWYDQWRGDCADRRPCPNPGESRHGGKCIQNASESASDRRKKAKAKAKGTKGPADPLATALPEGAQPAVTTPEGGTAFQRSDTDIGTIMAQLPEQEAVPPPPEFRRRSLSDVLADPRVVRGGAEAARSIGSIAEASGVRGAPVLAARAGAARGIHSDAYGRALSEDLASFAPRAAANTERYRRAASTWDRRAGAAGRQVGFNLQNRALTQADRAGGQVDLRIGQDDRRIDLAERGLGGTLAQQDWMRGWLPLQQQRNLDYQRWALRRNLDFNKWATEYGGDLSIVLASNPGAAPAAASPPVYL